MLVIKNIEKLIGKVIHGRRIISVSDNGWDGTAYVIKFDELPLKVPGPYYSNWEDSFEIYLVRIPKMGEYNIFWMGLHGRTTQMIDVDTIKNLANFTESIRLVIESGEKYYLNR